MAGETVAIQAVCPNCKREMTLDSSGALPSHRRSPDAMSRCPGSDYRPPASALVSPGDGLADATTLAAVPEPRDIAEKDAARIVAALEEREAAQERVEKAVAQALKNGCSIRAVVEATGLSPNTIQKYGARWGWPTKENRANFNASKYARR